MAKDYYVVLGVNRTASPRLIKRAYREMAKKYHPDSGQAGSDAGRFREVTRAYETLADAERRRRYDAELKAPEQPPARRTTRQRGRSRPAPPIEPLAEAPAPSVGPLVTAADVLLEVVLTRAEAAGGGIFPVHLPVTEGCPGCGDGWERLLCPVCGGRGFVSTERVIGLSIPPGTRHGAEATLRFETDRGVRRVHVRVLVDSGA